MNNGLVIKCVLGGQVQQKIKKELRRLKKKIPKHALCKTTATIFQFSVLRCLHLPSYKRCKSEAGKKRREGATQRQTGSHLAAQKMASPFPLTFRFAFYFFFPFLICFKSSLPVSVLLQRRLNALC